MFPTPITLMLLIDVSAFWSWIERHAHPAVTNGGVVDAVE
jgi:hypothetical protein